MPAGHLWTTDSSLSPRTDNPASNTRRAASCDAFLGGRVYLWQPRRGGYRAGLDPVLLAAAVPAKTAQSVLDLGCGAGAAMLCLAARVPGLRLTGIERHPAYAALARSNAALNGTKAHVVEGDITRLPSEVRSEQFDHVTANPPYFNRARSDSAPDAGREAAMGEDTPLNLWIGVMAQRLRPGGHATMIHRAERLPDLLSAAESTDLGSIEVLPLVPRRGQGARLVILQARKGGRADFRLHDGWVLHTGTEHTGDQENHTPATASVLRDGAALPLGAADRFKSDRKNPAGRVETS